MHLHTFLNFTYYIYYLISMYAFTELEVISRHTLLNNILYADYQINKLSMMICILHNAHH